MSVIVFEEITSSSISSSSSSSSSSSEREKPYSFTALLIHGLLGCRHDFINFAKSLVSSLSTGWRMVVVDLRNHGSSVNREGLSPPHDIANAANDLANLVMSFDWAWPDVVIGHSLGGKVAFQYALSCARGDYGDSTQIPKQLWVLDSVPGKIDNYEVVDKVLHTLQTLPSPIPSQEWLVDHMNNLGFSKFLSEWISSSLKKSGEHMAFTFNIDGVIEIFESARECDYWSLLEEPPKGMEIAIVRTENLVMWDPDVVDRLESLANLDIDESRGKVSVHVVPRAGHWIYKDEPERLLEIMTPRIASLVQPNY